MSRIWDWLRDEKNRAVLAMIGAAIGAIAAAYVYFFPKPDKAKPAVSEVTSDCGSVAVGGNVSGATITADNKGNCAKSTPGERP